MAVNEITDVAICRSPLNLELAVDSHKAFSAKA